MPRYLPGPASSACTPHMPMNASSAPLTMADAVARHALERPNDIAFVCDDEVLTFGQLDRRASQVANGLRAAGVHPGDRVAFLGKNSNAFVEIAVGAVRMGAVFTPLNWRLAGPEIAFMLADSAASLIVAESAYTATFDSMGEPAAQLRARICLDAPAPAGWLDYAGWRDARAIRTEPHPARQGDIALQIYTSGTTGRPKGVMLTHRNARSIVGLESPQGWPQWNMWQPQDISLITSPMFHVGGIGWTLRGLFPGSTQVVLREFTPAGVLQALQRHRISRTALVPSAMRMVLREPGIEQADFASLQYIYYGTSPIPMDLLREGMRVFACNFVQSYGQTETSSGIAALSPQDHTLEDKPHMRSAGKALPGIEIVIRDDSGNQVPCGTVGEIVTRSPSNMAGYANMPRETAETLSADGWLRTGDAGWMDADGYIYVQDRIKEMIITGGENVYPAEVENAIYGHPAVGDVAVIGVPSAQWGQAVKAVIELRPGQQATEAEIIAWARQRIGGYKLPKSVDFIAALPRNSTGKVVKGELRKLYPTADVLRSPPR